MTILTNQTHSALSVPDRVSLSPAEKWHKGRRLAASLARRYTADPEFAYDLYLAGLLALPDIIAANPRHSMGFVHAIAWPMRQVITRAAAELHTYQHQLTGLPETLRRVIETGHLF